MKNKNIFIDLLMLIVFIVGVGALIYPFVSDSVHDFLDQQIIQYYQEKANQENREEMDRIHAEMEAKNKEIARKSAPGVDPYSIINEEEPVVQAPISFYEEHTIGVVTIPDINVRLPIFDRTLPVLLEKGAALLEGTSFPTGGESTHSVITSHSGISQAKLFTDLEQLEVGDEFFVEINNRTHAYKIDQIKVVLPTETNDVKVVEGEDYVTLLTCTPYMINSHRLLVRGHRIPYVPQVAEKIGKVTEAQQTNILLMGSMVTVLGLFIIGLFYRLVSGYFISQRTYNLALQLTDENNTPISKVSFYLFNAKGGKAILDKDKNPIVLLSDETGEIKATNLPGGKYTLQNREKNMMITMYVKKVKQEVFSTKIKKNPLKWKETKPNRTSLVMEKPN